LITIVFNEDLQMSDEKSVRIVVPAEIFVKTWQSCETADDVAKKLNMDVGNVRTRALNLKKKYNIPLKEMPKASRGRKLDIEALKQLCIQ
jgi:hypothetical protein